MPLPVTVTVADPDPGVCPATFSEAVTIIRTLLGGTVGGTYVPYVMGTATPGADDQDKLWFKLDAHGRPLGVFKYYSGSWRRFYDGRIGEVRMFTGDPEGVFDPTGLGMIGGDYDGFALMNGQNGTVDASDRFIVGAHMNNADSVNGYDSGWRTVVAGAPAETGGGTEFTIADENLPLMETKIVGNRGDDPGADQSPLKPIIDDDYKIGPGMVTTLDLSSFGQEEPEPISILPSFFTLAFVQFVGYA